MSYLVLLTAFAPAMLVTLLAYNYLGVEAGSRQIKLGIVLFCLVLPPAVGLFAEVPGGAFADLPASLQQPVDYIAELALSPIAGLFVLSIMLISRGLWRLHVVRRYTRRHS